MIHRLRVGSRHTLVLPALLTVGALAFACGSTPSPDAPSDPAPPHVGAADAAPEAAPSDASRDATTTTPLADLPAIACSDTLSNVYVAPGGLPSMTLALRGAIVRCALDGHLDAAAITSKLSAASVTGITPTSDTTVYRIAYRTFRNDGVAGISTARVYLPTTQRSTPLPVLAIAHATVGLADSCAPSEDPASLNDVALPWASRGFAVVVPDYAGLGNEGVQGYAANHDEAHSLLDGARALRALLPDGAFDHRVLLAGYSQGGGAVLAAQGLAGSYGAGGDIVAAIVFAPEFFSRLASFGYVQMLRNPDSLTITTGISKPVVAAYRDYAASYNVLGVTSAGLTFPADKRDGILQAADAQCQTPFGGYIQAVAPYIRDLFDDDYRTSMLACIDGTSGCTGIASQLYTWLQSDLVPPDPKGAPVLYLQGLLDPIMPPNEEAACNLGILQKAGVATQLCTDASASHTDVVPRNVAFAVSWGEAKLDGKSTPTCSGDNLPACTLE